MSKTHTKLQLKTETLLTLSGASLMAVFGGGANSGQYSDDTICGAQLPPNPHSMLGYCGPEVPEHLPPKKQQKEGRSPDQAKRG